MIVGMKKKVFALGLLMSLFLMGCSTSDSNSYPTDDNASSEGEEIRELTVKLNQTAAEVEVGHSVSVLDMNASEGITYTHTETGIGEVIVREASNGSWMLTGNKAGTVNFKVTAKKGNETAEGTCVVIVKEAQGGGETNVPVSSVSLNKTSLEMFEDDSSFSLIATVLPDNATNKNVTWSSSNTSVATVFDGSVTPVGVGNTIITVSTVDGNKTAECNVTIKEHITIPNYVLHGLFYGDAEWSDKQMVINPYSATEYMIQGVSLHANDEFKVHMYGDTWYGYSSVKSSTPSGLVGKAQSNDNIKVLTTGVYDIYANYNESDGGHIYLARVDESTPTPSNVNVTGISLSHSGKYLLVRNEFIITPNVYPSNATNKEVTWTSSDTSIATVTSAGRVVASYSSKVGSTTITAKTMDGGYTATCIVYVSASQYPDYCLNGVVGGKRVVGWNMKYAAVPLSTGKYLIPDVDLSAGDSLSVLTNSGAKLKNKTYQEYTKSIDQNMSVNIYLDINDVNKDYLTFASKSGN